MRVRRIFCLFLLVGFLFPLTLAHSGSDPLFLGNWKNVKNGFDDEMAFNQDGSFQTWLHSRPSTFGKWVLKGNQIIINVEGFPAPRVITHWELKGNQLILTEEGEGKSIWKKLK